MRRPRRYATGTTLVCLFIAAGLRAQVRDDPDPASEGESSGDEFSFGDTSDLDGNAAGAAPPAVDLAAPPAENRGAIVGTLIDARTGEPILEARISIPGTPYVTVTDFEGRFRLEVPPGIYELRYFEGTHQPARTSGLTVVAGETVTASARLVPLEGMVQETEIVAKAEQSRLEGQLLARQRAAASGDVIGRAEIAKTPDSNAAEAAKRVVGANVVAGRFVYVRGLGERYTNSLLDLAPLPSPEPDRAAVPLDLFPVDVVDNITIVKTFTPDLPGDFAGGSVQIDTRSIPEEPIASLSVSGGYNTRATFRDRHDYPGSRGDWLGHDSGLRQLPAAVPDDYPLTVGAATGEGTALTREDLQGYGRLLNSSLRWRTDAFTPPNHGLGLVLGNGWELPGQQHLGAVGSVGYGRSYVERRGVVREFNGDPADPRGYSELVDYDVVEGEDSVRWGAFGSVAYVPARNHELRLVALHSQLADDTTRVFDGYSDEMGGEVSGARLQYASRGLDLGKLSGDHEIAAFNRARLAWSAQVSRATRDEPDTRDVGYARRALGELVYRVNVDADSGRHFFSDLVENGIAGTLDYTQPLDLRRTVKLKAGGVVSLRHRDFESRRFNFFPRPGVSLGCTLEEFGPGCPDQTFQPSAIESGDLRFEERTFASDQYRSELDVFAGYLMTDVRVAPTLRLIAGERVEKTHQLIHTKAFVPGNFDDARVESTDLLPSASLILSASERTKLRTSATRTLARPQLRELAPFSFNDYYLGRTTTGNTELDLTRVTNLDLRLEHFPTLREVVAVSLFYKRFTDPIEPVLRPATGSGGVMNTYQNTPGAWVVGVELESRKELDFLAAALEDVSAVANLTLTRSRIELEQTGSGTITNLERPLVNQAPWVLNLALDYDNEDSGTRARLSYNVAGPSIVEVGAVGIDDAYQQPQHLIDLTASQLVARHLTLKAGVEDLLDSETLVTQGRRVRSGNVRERHRDGAVVFAGASYAF